MVWDQRGIGLLPPLPVDPPLGGEDRKKGRKHNPSLDPDDEARLVGDITSKPLLWDTTDQSYKNKPEVRAHWEELDKIYFPNGGSTWTWFLSARHRGLPNSEPEVRSSRDTSLPPSKAAKGP